MLNHWFKKNGPENQEKSSSGAAPQAGAAVSAREQAMLPEPSWATGSTSEREAALAQVQDEAEIKRIAKWAADHDKRLYRLAQGRLNERRQQAMAQTEAARLIEAYTQWLETDVLALNRIAELDQAWAAIEKKLSSPQQVDQHALLRSRLENRILARIQLQQQANHLRLQLEGLRADIDSAGQLKLDALSQALEQLAQQLPTLVTSPEISALSAQQITILDEALTSARQAWYARHEHFEAVAQALQASQSKEVKTVVEPRTTKKLTPPSAAEKLERAEQSRLRDWQQFGTEVVRLGLIEEAESLPILGHAPESLADTVKELRERWKKVDAQIGTGAPAALWKRFDQACEKAYAPAAQWLAQQALLREENTRKKQQLLEQAEAEVQSLITEHSPDWKKISATVDSLRQRWRAVGPVKREQSKALVQKFDAALDRLIQPLQRQREKEQVERQSLISKARQLTQQGITNFSQLRHLQQDWQSRARHCPLPTHLEQALWTEFRHACQQVADQIKQAKNTERERELQGQRERRERELEQKNHLLNTVKKMHLLCQPQHDAGLPEQWESMGSAGPFEKILQKRLQQTQTLSPDFDDQLIRLEIESGLPSPGAEVRRRELQINLLAQKLKGAQVLGSVRQVFESLLAQAYEQRHVERLVTVLQHYPQWFKSAVQEKKLQPRR